MRALRINHDGRLTFYLLQPGGKGARESVKERETTGWLQGLAFVIAFSYKNGVIHNSWLLD